MELFDLTSPMEELLAQKASNRFFALGGTMELLPLCNMDCRMCYIRQTKEEMDRQGRMLTCDEWLRIAREMKKMGVLYLLLTGGEPLIYPEFERLYTELTKMGFVISVNTNATLIDETWADLFGRFPCRRFSITLYGKDDATYARLCRNPKGFTQVMRAAQLLKERNVPFRFTCSVTPDNRADLPELHGIARRFDVPLQTCSYMFPPARKPEGSDAFVRMSPEDAAASILEDFLAKNQNDDLIQVASNTIAKGQEAKDWRGYTGFYCRAGRSGFWINWKGEMLPCGMLTEPSISLLEHSFLACWKHIVVETQKIKRCADCDACPKREVCKVCVAACKAETGRFDGKPGYLCQMTDELLTLSKRIAED